MSRYLDPEILLLKMLLSLSESKYFFQKTSYSDNVVSHDGPAFHLSFKFLKYHFL
jgi:hypothetical protein